jgi:broad specificity phosphatase PhoE
LLRDRDIRAVISSEERKAVATAQAMAAHLGVPTRACAGFEEQHHRNSEWLDADEFDRRVAAALDAPEARSFGDESANEAADRFRAALSRLAEAESGQVAVVTHGRVLTAFIARHNRIAASEFWKRLEMPAYAVVRASSFELVHVDYDPCKVAE